MKSTPKILYVAEGWDHGAQVRGLNILRALRQIGTVEVVMLGDSVRVCEPIREASQEAKFAYTLDVRPFPNKTLRSKLIWTFDQRSHYPFGCSVDAEGARRLLETYSSVDLIWFFKLRAAEMFPNRAWERSVVDIDDIPSTCALSSSRLGGPVNRTKSLRDAFSWRRRERTLGKRFNVLSVCSERDRDYLLKMGVAAPIHVIPNGFERPLNEPLRVPAAPARIGFIGAFDYMPNHDGVTWFVKECWPIIKRGIPDARLRLIGRASEKLNDLRGLDIDVLGYLPNTSEEIQTWSVMVVPIRMGSGTRVKIAHGFSQKCPIVSTSVGGLGYAAVSGHEMHITDSADAFSNACIKVIRDPEGAQQMAERAWIEFEKRWSWEAIRPQVWAAAKDCLQLNTR
jgi:glycosyltransferase involved in cell wall biosynthesis